MRGNSVTTKLTLTIEKSTIEKAKVYARKRGRSLSGIVENYLKIVAKDAKGSEIEITPIVKSLKGAFKTSRNFDYKKELSKELSKKYLR